MPVKRTTRTTRSNTRKLEEELDLAGIIADKFVLYSVPLMTMTVEEMGKELHITRTVAYRLIEEKGFPIFTIGRRRLVNRKMLQELIDEKTREQMVAILTRHREMSEPAAI